MNLQNAFTNLNENNGIAFPKNTTHDPIGFWYSKFYRKMHPQFGLYSHEDGRPFDPKDVLQDFNFTLVDSVGNSVQMKWNLSIN